MPSQKEIKQIESVQISTRSEMAFFDKHVLISELLSQIRNDTDSFEFEMIQRQDGKYEHKAKIQIFKNIK